MPLTSLPTHEAAEIALRMILSVSLMAINGFARAEAEEVDAEGNELFVSTIPSPQSFNRVYLLGLFMYYRGKIGPAREIVAELLRLTSRLEDPTLP